MEYKCSNVDSLTVTVYVCMVTVSFHVISQTQHLETAVLRRRARMLGTVYCHLHVVQSADTFRRHLKTFLFNQAFLS